MRKIWLAGLLALVLLLSFHSAAQQPAPKLKPLAFSVECAEGDCQILKGAPQTSGMRSGSVRLKHGESVGWHSTEQNEEVLTILHGSGVANIEGHADIPLRTNMLAYFPPNTRHNVTNNGNELLEYVWVVAPAAKPQSAQ